MNAAKLGIVSALAASACCLGPLILVLLGLGGLGMGAALGRFHWWFILIGAGLLAFAWHRDQREARRCRTAHCATARGAATRMVLILASVIVAVFLGLNLYTYAGRRVGTRRPGAGLPGGQTGAATKALAAVVIPVKGMTCFTCELSVESSLKGLPGVRSADANVRDQAVYVNYDPAQVTLDALITAINTTGYKASPSVARRQ